MSLILPTCEALKLSVVDSCLYLTFNRPEARNAMTAGMNAEIRTVFETIRERPEVRVVVLRGVGGWFCSGGDLKERQAAASRETGETFQAIKKRNALSGELFRLINTAPQAVVAVVEGAAVGGGFGMACVADVTITQADALFGMPETGIGVAPAQIASHVVKRIGLSRARRLAVTGAKFNGREAVSIGVAHFSCDTPLEVDEKLSEVLRDILRCGPNAIAATKEIMLCADQLSGTETIEFAAERFARCVMSVEGREGTRSFIEKRRPSWTPKRT